MLSKKSFFVIAVFFILIMVVVYAYNEYHREPLNVEDVKSDLSVTATEMTQAFENDETSANEHFLGKIIDVKGTVIEVKNQGDTLVNIFLGAANKPGKVSCLIDETHTKEALKISPGSVHTIRGVCTGYLMDVELNRCVVIQ